MEWYKRIKQRREELGLSQEELARAAGYKDRSTIAKIENGTNDVTQTKIAELSKALKISPVDLMGWGEDHSANEPKISMNLDLKTMEYIEKIKKLSAEQQKLLDIFIKGLNDQ